MIEDKKQEVGTSEASGCMCQRMSTCEGGMHRFCFKRCCMMKSVLAALVLVVIFSAGFCAGHGGDRHERFGRGEHGYRGAHMMMGGMMERGEQYQGYGQYYPSAPMQGQYNVMYRTTMPTQTVITGSSTMAVPAGMPMMVRQIPQQ